MKSVVSEVRSKSPLGKLGLELELEFDKTLKKKKSSYTQLERK